MKIAALFALLVVSLQAQSLKLASYNIKHGRNMKNKMNLQATANKLKEFKADIIALQEVDKNCSRSGKIDQAKFIAEALSMHHKFAKFMDYQGGEYGLALLSKYPIHETKVHHLPAGAEPRVALEIIVEPTKGKKASFICIHFDYTSEEKRQPQIKALLKALENTNHPIALMGDFNATPMSESIALFQKNWFNVPKRGNQLTFPSDNPKVEIDYFMLKGFKTEKTTCKVIEETAISDHRPIVTNVEMK